VKASLRTLLNEVVDYAGLFPPAGLGMRETAMNYASYHSGAHAWALGRVIVPVSRLDEFEGVMRFLPAVAADAPRWRLSALAGDRWEHDGEKIRAFNDRGRDVRGRAMQIDTVELKAPDLADLSRVGKSFPASLRIYVEIPIEDDPGEAARAISEAGLFAKARTGGIEEAMFPATEEIMRFMERCRQWGIAFKFTAGLHHGLRSVYRLTYAPDSPTGRMHGFLNLLLAAAFLYAGVGTSEVAAIVEESSPRAFAFDDDGVSWRSRRVSTQAIGAMRREFAMSFGSCSFEEPIADLAGMSLL
jgi:hypothetical protein